MLHEVNFSEMSRQSGLADVRAVIFYLHLVAVISACHGESSNARSGLPPQCEVGRERVACAPGTPQAQQEPMQGRATMEHFSIDVPARFELRDVSPPMMDFDLYELVDRETNKGRCGIYLGNFPRFPTFSWSGSPEISKEPGREKKEFRNTTRIEGTITFSGLSYKASAGTPWTVIHYFADELSERDRQLIDRMIQSIEVTRRHLD